MPKVYSAVLSVKSLAVSPIDQLLVNGIILFLYTLSMWDGEGIYLSTLCLYNNLVKTYLI